MKTIGLPGKHLFNNRPSATCSRAAELIIGCSPKAPPQASQAFIAT
ncbi:MAG: hypothetical protein ABSG80_07985 [Verrucomicrobiota bacterium]